MFVEGMLEMAREKLVTIANDARLIEAAKLLSSGTDLVIVCDSEGILQGVVTKTDVVRQISVCQGATCMCPADGHDARCCAVSGGGPSTGRLQADEGAAPEEYPRCGRG